MNLTPNLQEKDIDGLRTEQVQKKKNEFHWIVDILPPLKRVGFLDASV